MEIDWEKAPEWAQYHAFDENGEGYWYGERPKPWVKLGVWGQSNGPDTSGYTKPGNINWLLSLTKREEKQDV